MSSLFRRIRRSLHLVGIGAAAAYFFDAENGAARRQAVVEWLQGLPGSSVLAGDEPVLDGGTNPEVDPGGPSHETWSDPPLVPSEAAATSAPSHPNSSS